MKKSLLALAVSAVAAASIASTASATTVYDKDGTSIALYGRVQSVFYSNEQSSTLDANGEGKASIKSSARFGFDLRTQLTPGVAGFAKGEWEMGNGDNQANDGSEYAARYLWVGTDFGQFGQIKFGKFEEAVKYALFATDIFEDYGGYGYSGNDDRREGVVQYQWSGNGIDALVSYQFAKQNDHVDGAYQSVSPETLDIDYSVSAAVGYTSPDVVFGPIAVRAGYSHAEFIKNAASNQVGFDPTTNTSLAQYKSYDQWALGASWGNLNLGPYIGAQFQQRKFDLDTFAVTPEETNGSATAKVTGYEFAAGYAFANGVWVRTGYQVQEYEVADSPKVKGATIPVFVMWNLNSQFQVWGEARFDAGTDNSADKNFAVATSGVYNNLDKNVFSVGMRYNF